MYDPGKSPNPAVDIGQLEGGYIQGVGFATTDGKVPPPDRPVVVPLSLGKSDAGAAIEAVFIPNFRIVALEWNIADASNLVVRKGTLGRLIHPSLPFRLINLLPGVDVRIVADRTQRVTEER